MNWAGKHTRKVAGNLSEKYAKQWQGTRQEKCNERIKEIYRNACKKELESKKARKYVQNVARNQEKYAKKVARK